MLEVVNPSVHFHLPNSQEIVQGVSINLKGFLKKCDSCGIKHPPKSDIRLQLRSTKCCLTVTKQWFLPVTRPPYFTYTINPCTDDTYTFLFYAIGTKEVCPPSCCIVKREWEGTLWVQCDGCQQWYHARCIGLSRKQLTRLDTFFCKCCK